MEKRPADGLLANMWQFVMIERVANEDSFSKVGNTGIAEVGYEWKRGNWEYNINAEGSFGKREGVTGSFNINYNF